MVVDQGTVVVWVRYVLLDHIYLTYRTSTTAVLCLRVIFAGCVFVCVCVRLCVRCVLV